MRGAVASILLIAATGIATADNTVCTGPRCVSAGVTGFIDGCEDSGLQRECDLHQVGRHSAAGFLTQGSLQGNLLDLCSDSNTKPFVSQGGSPRSWGGSFGTGPCSKPDQHAYASFCASFFTHARSTGTDLLFSVIADDQGQLVLCGPGLPKPPSGGGGGCGGTPSLTTILSSLVSDDPRPPHVDLLAFTKPSLSVMTC